MTHPLLLVAFAAVLTGCASGGARTMRTLHSEPNFRVRVSEVEPGVNTVRIQVDALAPFHSAGDAKLRGVRAVCWRDVDGDGFPDPAEPRTTRTQDALVPSLTQLVTMTLPAGRPLWITLDVLLDTGWATWVPPRLLAAEPEPEVGDGVR